jgi:hypothetical protein
MCCVVGDSVVGPQGGGLQDLQRTGSRIDAGRIREIVHLSGCAMCAIRVGSVIVGDEFSVGSTAVHRLLLL